MVEHNLQFQQVFVDVVVEKIEMMQNQYLVVDLDELMVHYLMKIYYHKI